MQTYHVKLDSAASASFRCVKAASALDIDVEEKLSHELQIEVDLNGETGEGYSVGLIVGASGTGKTTLARAMFGETTFVASLAGELPVLDQLPDDLEYDVCADILTGIGLSQVPCWIRPAHTLSNGQRSRAEIAVALARAVPGETLVVDEFTSVVDRTVAKIMSHAVQRHIRRRPGLRIVLLSCHYDIEQWLDPDWVIDCNTHEWIDRRRLCPRPARAERLRFEIRRLANGRSWRAFARYHYLSADLPRGKCIFFGLFHEGRQVGFQCFANYVPQRPGTSIIMHSNRTVIHPDYVGFGLGIKLITETSKQMVLDGYEVMAKYTSVPVYRAMARDSAWRLERADYETAVPKLNPGRARTVRTRVQWFSFRFVWRPGASAQDGTAAGPVPPG